MTEERAEYCVSKATKTLRGIGCLRKRLQNWFTVLSVECRCYAIGLAVIIVAALLALFKRPEAGFLVQLGVCVFALGLLPVIEDLYEWAWRKLLGKLLIAALIALATNIAYGFGRQMVSSLVGTSPEPFSATVNIATILVSPVLFLAALAIGGVFILIIALCVGMLASMAFLFSQSRSRGRSVVLWMCRIAALTLAVSGSWHLLNHSTGYAGWVERRAAAYLYTFDMYHDAQYATSKTEKVSFLGNDRILLAVPKQGGGYTLEIRRFTDGNEASQ
jgi:hypothetical protein